MKAVIIGGGIGGLTTAIALERIGIETEVFEANFSRQTAGAGIWMAPNAMQVFDRLGFAQEVIKQGIPLEKVEITDNQFRTIQELPQHLTLNHFGFTVTSILRSRLRSILLKN
jgi:2-polyprenyl-6-methoxyphenol hydroxylase-like FAD-dependent oxidoreductase